MHSCIVDEMQKTKEIRPFFLVVRAWWSMVNFSVLEDSGIWSLVRVFIFLFVSSLLLLIVRESKGRTN